MRSARRPRHRSVHALRTRSPLESGRWRLRLQTPGERQHLRGEAVQVLSRPHPPESVFKISRNTHNARRRGIALLIHRGSPSAAAGPRVMKPGHDEATAGPVGAGSAGWKATAAHEFLLENEGISEECACRVLVGRRRGRGTGESSRSGSASGIATRVIGSSLGSGRDDLSPAHGGWGARELSCACGRVRGRSPQTPGTELGGRLPEGCEEAPSRAPCWR